MKDRTVGVTIVRDIRIEVQLDSSGEEACFIVLVLSDPPPGQESWPIEDLRAMRESLREYIAARAPDLDVPWYVVFEPEHPELEDEFPEQLGFLFD